MQIVEVKNNFVRISYDTSTKLVLSGFIVIKDSTQSFIAQIIHLESNQYGNFAVLKLLFTFDDTGVITNYNGSIPDAKCVIDIVQPQELLELLPVQNPVFLGELAQQKILLNLDRKFLEEKLLVCSDKSDDSSLVAKNFTAQLAKEGKKVLVFDLNGTFDVPSSKVFAGNNFKLPLNYDSINFIYEKGLQDAKAETKALIQNIFLEVQDYVKTLPQKFIPFETFKDVVDSQYEELGLVELVLLKNKLLKFHEEGVFAQDKKEFDSLEKSLKMPLPTVFDLSKMDVKVQREMISYAYSLVKDLGNEVYVIFSVEDEISDKKLLKQIFTTQNAYTTIISSYSYKYLKELKQLSKNLMMFAPIQQQNDFAGYGVFLNKLNAHEFVVYGSLTHHLPLIVRLDEYSKYFEASTAESGQQVEDVQEIEEESLTQESLDEQIKRDVDEIYTVPKSEIEPKTEVFAEQELTEEDLDVFDDFDITEIQEESPEKEISEEVLEPEQDQEGFDFSALEEESLIEEVVEEQETQETLPEFQEVSEEFDLEEEKIDFQEVVEIQEAESAEQVEISEESPLESFTDIMAQQKAAPEAPEVDILPAKMASTPIVPIYSAEIEPKVQSDDIGQGDVVVHPKYGKGVVEKLITYGSKTLCSINFDNVGRRLLDPSLAEIRKASD